jgi:hypothetical protein
MDRTRAQHLLMLKVIGEVLALKSALHVVLKNQPEDVREKVREFIGETVASARRGTRRGTPSSC